MGSNFHSPINTYFRDGEIVLWFKVLACRVQIPDGSVTCDEVFRTAVTSTKKDPEDGTVVFCPGQV